jgi:predicted dehydrogenase
MSPQRAPTGSPGGLRDLFGHSPLDKMFDRADVYGTGYEPERADRAPLRVGLIGAGGVAQSKWLPALARLRTLWDPVRLVGVAEPSTAQGQKVVALHGGQWYPDERELLEKERLDAVIVASPDHWHARHARAALEAGVAALVEKPFCSSLSEAEGLCELSAERDVCLMPVCNLRFAPPFRRAREMTSTSEGFAQPMVLLGKMNLGYDYVDLLEGAAVHLLDLARFFLGNVSTLNARGLGGKPGRRAYPCRKALVSLEFEGGAMAQLFTSSDALSLKPWLRVEVHGQGSWLAVDDVLELVVYDSEVGPAKSWKPVMASTLLFDEEFGGYMPQLEHFLQVVRGDEAAAVTPTDGYRAVELIAATHLSMARASEVALPLGQSAADDELRRLRASW